MKKLILIIPGIIILSIFSCTQADVLLVPVYIDNDTYVVNFQEGNLPNASYDGCEDTFIYSNQPTTNFDFSALFSIGFSGSEDEYRGLIRFDISGHLPTDIEIEKAYLTLSVNDPLADYTFQAFSLDTDWVEDEVTWNDSEAGQAWAGGSWETGNIGSADYKMDETSFTIEIDSDVVQDWLTNSGGYGIIIMPQASSNTVHVIFHSSIFGEADKRPLLTIYYNLPRDD